LKHVEGEPNILAAKASCFFWPHMARGICKSGHLQMASTNVPLSSAYLTAYIVLYSIFPYSAATRSSGTDRTQVDHDVSLDAGESPSMLQRRCADQQQQQDRRSPACISGSVLSHNLQGSSPLWVRCGFVVPHSPTAAHVPKDHFHLLIRPSSHLTFLTITSSGREIRHFSF